MALKLTTELPKGLRVNPGSRAPKVQHTLAELNGAFVRIHRIGAPPPGANRNVLDTRDDQRLTFVLIHGIGLSSVYLIPLAQELSRLGEVLMLDLPGFGEVPPPESRMSIAGFAAVVDHALRINGISDPILVGHSMGAQIVTELMARDHVRYRRACLIGPPVNAQERSAPKVLGRYLQSSLYESSDLVLVAIWSYLRTVTSFFLATLPQLLEYPIEDRIQDSSPDAEFLILHGEYDYLAPSAWTEFLAQRAGNARCFMVPEVAHSTLYNADDDVATLIKTLLTDDELAGVGKRHW